MGKMFNALVLSGIISIVLLIFDGAGVLGVIAKLFLSPPTNWGTFLLDSLTTALGVSTIAGLSGIIIGATVIKLDWLVRLGFFTVLVSWVNAPFISLWTFLSGKILPLESCVNSYTCTILVDGGTATTLGMIISALIVGPMILYAVWACWTQIWSPESSG